MTCGYVIPGTLLPGLNLLWLTDSCASSTPEPIKGQTVDLWEILHKAADHTVAIYLPISGGAGGEWLDLDYPRGCRVTEPFPDDDDLSVHVLSARDGIQNILFSLQRKTDIWTWEWIMQKEYGFNIQAGWMDWTFSSCLPFILLLYVKFYSFKYLLANCGVDRGMILTA